MPKPTPTPPKKEKGSKSRKQKAKKQQQQMSKTNFLVNDEMCARFDPSAPAWVNEREMERLKGVMKKTVQER